MLSIRYFFQTLMKLHIPRQNFEKSSNMNFQDQRIIELLKSKMDMLYNPYPTAFPYGNGMVLHFYQQQESSTTKTVHRVINKGLKTYV